MKMYESSSLTLQDVCFPLTPKFNMTVIGNGPLSYNQRLEIKGIPRCVVRFNKMENYRRGEPFHALALREHTMPFSSRYNKTIIPVISSDVHLENLYGKHLDPIYVTQHQYRLIPKYEHLRLFEGCNESRLHRSTLKGPSTGAAVIDFLQKHENVSHVHVFGMNWNGVKQHVDFKYKNIVRQCCTKCVIHQTPSGTYHS